MLGLVGGLVSSRGVQASMTDGCPDLIVETFGERAPQACAVADCETGGTFDPMSTGRLGERGWFQIHPSWGWRSSYDPEVNTAFAYELSRGGWDWSSWSCSP